MVIKTKITTLEQLLDVLSRINDIFVSKSTASNTYVAKSDPITIDLSAYLTAAEVANGYVAKVSNKGLSTNDFTTTEKSKLAGIDINELSGADSLNKYITLWWRGADPANPLKDEGANVWTKTGGSAATLTTKNAVAGVQINGVYETYDVYLGGKDFTVEGRLGDVDSTANVAFHIWRTGESMGNFGGGLFGFDQWINSGSQMIAWYVATGATGGSSASPTDTFHFALCYNHSDSMLRCFVNGRQITTGAVKIARSRYSIQLGTSGKTLEHFRIFDGVSRWNSDFTPPNDYSLNTKKLFIVNNGKKYVVEAREAYLHEL